jgi:hypothetical protein
MKKSKSAFSLIIAISLVFVSVALVLYILEYIILFWRDISWIEQSTQSYYLATSWVEQGLYFFSTRTGSSLINETRATISVDNLWSNVGYSFHTTSSWTTIPERWWWDSEFDKDWNTISVWNPLQLSVWYDWLKLNLSKLDIKFRVPAMWAWLTRPTLSWGLSLVSWWISSSTGTLNSSWTFIANNEISNLSSNNDGLSKSLLNNLRWRLTNWVEKSFEDFINDNCWANEKCILRFFVTVPSIITANNTVVPFLEWKFGTNKFLPLRYSRIEATWNAKSFSTNLSVRVPQETASEALDFVVIQ